MEIKNIEKSHSFCQVANVYSVTAFTNSKKILQIIIIDVSVVDFCLNKLSIY